MGFMYMYVFAVDFVELWTSMKYSVSCESHIIDLNVQVWLFLDKVETLTIMEPCKFG